MRTGNLVRAVVVSAAILSFVETASAQQGEVERRVFDSYHLTAGAMYNDHASEHVSILRRLATSGQPMPGSILKEHADAIRANLQASANALGKVSEVQRRNPQVASAFAAIQTRLNQLQSRTTQLAAATDTRQVTLIANEIETGLNDNLKTELQIGSVIMPTQAPVTSFQREWPSDLPYTD